jgi:hypothetical protein
LVEIPLPTTSARLDHPQRFHERRASDPAIDFASRRGVAARGRHDERPANPKIHTHTDNDTETGAQKRGTPHAERFASAGGSTRASSFKGEESGAV